MTPDVVDALANLKERGYLAEDGDLVFCSATGAHLDHFTVRRHFHSAIKRAELRRIRFHDLRHHFGSMAITVLDGYAVQSYTGHQHYTTTQRYLHHKPRKEDAAKLGAAFAESEAPATHQREPGRLLDSARSTTSSRSSALSKSPTKPSNTPMCSPTTANGGRGSFPCTRSLRSL